MVVPRNYLKEFFNAPEEILSLKEATDESLQIKFTEMRDVYFDVHFIRTKLTGLDNEITEAILDELDAAFTDAFGATGEGILGSLIHFLTLDWTPHVPYEKALNIIARVNNRVFIGLPLCVIEQSQR